MPRKNVAGFPGQAERRRLMNELKNSGDPSIAAFAAAIETLDGEMERYETPQGVYNLAPTLTEKDKTNLMRAILESARHGETYLAAAEKAKMDMTRGVPALVEELQSLLSVNYDALARYEPEMGLSLPELQQAARTVTVDLRGQKLDRFGSAQNSRLRMTVVDADGTRRQGFFTKNKQVNVLDAYNRGLTRALELCGKNQKARTSLQGFLQAFGTYWKQLDDEKGTAYQGLDPTASEENAITYLALRLNDRFRDGKYQMGMAKAILTQAGLDAKQFPPEAIKALDLAFRTTMEDTGNLINVRDLGLRDGNRLDDRNASMSAVADLLGVPGLLAKAVPMRCVDQNGEVVEGTFMDYAEGEDLCAGPEKLTKAIDDPDQLYAVGEGHFVKDMVDLQVLDYICGNVDRHEANLAYQLNGKGQIIGVQGFDNDSSFGLFDKIEKGRNQMDGLQYMRVMSKSMYDRITSTTPEMLKLSLRGTGRSPEEIRFACSRLQDLKTLISEKKPTVYEKGEFPTDRIPEGYHVVPDEDLNRIDPRTLQKTRKGSVLDTVMTEVGQHHAKAKALGSKYSRSYYESHREQFDKRPDIPEVGTAERKHTAGGLGESLKEASAIYKNEVTGAFIEKDTGYWSRSSGEFRQMVRAAADAAKLQKDLTQRLSKSGDRERLLREDQSVAKEKHKADTAMTRLSTEVDKYLARKRTQRGVSDEALLENAKNDYEKKRIQFALDLKKACKNYRELNDPQAAKEAGEKQTAKTLLETAKNRETARKSQQAAAPKGPALQN